MRDEYTRELKNAFIEEINNQGMYNRVQNNVVALAFEPAKQLRINHAVKMAVSFFREEIMVTIMDIARVTNRPGTLALLNQKNQEIIYGKYCLTDDGKIEYKSLKWVPSSKKDPTCVFELMINCLKEFAQAHDEIVNSESCL